MEQKFIAPEDLAEWLQVSPWTIQKWRARRQGPPYQRVTHKTVRYDIEEVKHWLATRRHEQAPS